MPIISSEQSGIIVILVFKVEPTNQQALIEAATRNSQEVMEKKSGFISASLHKSIDGTSMVNYSQWESRKSYDEAINFLSNEEVKIGEKIFDLADPDWNIYELAFSSGKSPAEISMGSQIATVINIFSTESKDQANLIEILESFSNGFVEKQPDFISANVIRSFDGKRVISYAQWKSKEAYQSLYTNTDALPYLDKIKSVSKFSWNLYDVVYTSD